MKRLAPCLAVVLTLAIAGLAEAKEPVSAKVCGAAECRIVKDREVLVALMHGGTPVGPPRPSAFYRSELRTRGDGRLHSFPVAVVPEAGLMRGGSEAEGYTWMPLSGRGAREYRRLTRGLEPLPASKLRGLRPWKARVDEVVLPPAAEPEPTASSLAWPWILSALAGAAVLALAVGRLRRRPGR